MFLVNMRFADEAGLHRGSNAGECRDDTTLEGAQRRNTENGNECEDQAVFSETLAFFVLDGVLELDVLGEDPVVELRHEMSSFLERPKDLLFSGLFADA